MKVIFVRHGKDDDNYRGGWSSLDLIPEGIKQAKQLAKHLKENNRDYAITQIVSSDLPRAMTTANIIAYELDLPVQKEFQIREANNGDLAGMPNHIANEKYPGLFFVPWKWMKLTLTERVLTIFTRELKSGFPRLFPVAVMKRVISWLSHTAVSSM